MSQAKCAEQAVSTFFAPPCNNNFAFSHPFCPHPAVLFRGSGTPSGKFWIWIFVCDCPNAACANSWLRWTRLGRFPKTFIPAANGATPLLDPGNTAGLLMPQPEYSVVRRSGESHDHPACARARNLRQTDHRFQCPVGFPRARQALATKCMLVLCNCCKRLIRA